MIFKIVGVRDYVLKLIESIGKVGGNMNNGMDNSVVECPVCHCELHTMQESVIHEKICGNTILLASKDEKQSLRESLAAYAHDAWSGWIKYQFGKCDFDSNGNLILPKEFVDRWVRQCTTPYKDLPESEKLSDRDEADKMLNLVAECIVEG